MSLGISCRVEPTASRAAILAIGNPVALLASALERDTRGFISITTTSSVAGLTANWTLEPPVLAVRQRLLGGHAHAVAGVHPHRVDVLDRADDHLVVGPVAHHLQLELAPAQHRLLDQHLADRGGAQPPPHHARQLPLVADHPAAGPAQG